MKRSLDRRWLPRRAQTKDRLHPGAAGLDDIVATPTKKQNLMALAFRRSAPQGRYIKGSTAVCKRSDEVLRDLRNMILDDGRDGRRRGVPCQNCTRVDAIAPDAPHVVRESRSGRRTRCKAVRHGEPMTDRPPRPWS
jgi:hypothetical protein